MDDQTPAARGRPNWAALTTLVVQNEALRRDVAALTTLCTDLLARVRSLESAQAQMLAQLSPPPPQPQ